MGTTFKRGLVLLFVIAFWAVTVESRAAQPVFDDLTWVEPKPGVDLKKLKREIEARGAKVIALAPEGRLLVRHPGMNSAAVRTGGAKSTRPMGKGVPLTAPSGARGLGGRRATDQEVARMKQATSVEPNELSIRRALLEGAEALPSMVDNSLSIYFPPIAQQGAQGSCAAFAAGYYYSTYLQAKDENLDASTGDPTRICSPAFIYNLMNGGIDEGSSDHYNLETISIIGISSWSAMPYDDNNYTNWPTEAAWVDALKRRTSETFSIGGGSYGFNDAHMLALKQHLANGNLAVTNTEVYYNWYANYLDKEGLNNGVLYANANGYVGGHALTIVGYDDNRPYFDGTTTKHGAFLLANSWGEGFGVSNTAGTSGGFMWVAYDFFKSTPYCFGNASYSTDRPHYRTKLYAVTGMNESQRAQVRYRGGVGTMATTNTVWLSNRALYGWGGTAVALDDTKRVAVDLNDGVRLIDYPNVRLFTEMEVLGSAPQSGTITSADFFHDLDGDGNYEVANSTDPTLTITPGQKKRATVHFNWCDNALNKFQISPIGASQTAWLPISASVTASDAAGNPVAGFSGPVSLAGCIESTRTVGTLVMDTTDDIMLSGRLSRFQSIYTASSVGQTPTTWTAVVFDISQVPGEVLGNFTIRMKHSPYVFYNDEGNPWETGFTTVYQHDTAITRTGLVRFDFDTPFVYNGTNHVMLDFSFYNSRESANTIFAYSYGYYPQTLYSLGWLETNPLTWDGLTTNSSARVGLPILRLISSRNVPISPGSISSWQSGVWTDNVVVKSQATGMMLIANDGAGHRGRSNVFNVAAGTPVGSVRVNLGPAEAVASGAQWRRSGASWHPGGYSETGITPGDYTVEFASIPGWTTPASQGVTVRAGETTTINGTYSPMSVVWVDFAFGGVEFGTISSPFFTLQHGISAVASGGTVRVKPGTSSEAIRITKPVRIEASGGHAIIGRR